MIYFVYILYSKIKAKYYIGYTQDLVARIVRHNQNSKGFTGKVDDWELVYSEQFSSEEAAVKREKQIKNWKSKTMIEKLVDGN